MREHGWWHVSAVTCHRREDSCGRADVACAYVCRSFRIGRHVVKALVYTHGHGVRFDEAPEPLPADGVVVDVVRAGICGTDLGAVRRGAPPLRSPVVVGHELVGTRTDTGEAVVANPILSCRDCVPCRRGDEHLCVRRQVLGVHRDGAFATRIAIPGQNLFPLGPAVGVTQAVLVEPLATALHAWRRVAPHKGARVGIIGAGAIGLCTLVAALGNGAAEVDVADIDPLKLDHARRIGAEATATELGGGYHVVFDTVGGTATRESAVTSLLPGGTAVLVGLHEPELRLQGSAVVAAERSILGSFAYRRADFADAVAMASTLDTDWVCVLPMEAGPGLLNGTRPAPPGASKIQLSINE
ncbi:zinc-binding dehydrogenase [Streptomyces sp. NPDC096354]|uniref:zinc-dependent alcohol dehydrogenase n=1 Tax=Streptomyces sp. NPDC096354 TaxID=3366088 RepID=UPI00380E8A47